MAVTSYEIGLAMAAAYVRNVRLSKKTRRDVLGEEDKQSRSVLDDYFSRRLA